MTPSVAIVVFLLGSAIGSFINVLALRYVPEKKLLGRHAVGGRSRCFSCQKTLKWYELIPLLSFLIQRGRCRSCSVGLSFQYPIVELFSGLILLGFALGFKNNFTWQEYAFLAVWILAAYILVLIAAIDFRLKIIPDELNIALAVLGVAVVAIKSAYWSHIIAALIALVFFGSVILLSKGRGMGVGDLKMAGAISLLMGWPDAMLSLVFSFVIGAAWSIGLLALGGKTLKDAVPFGPFLSAGVLITVFFGEQILGYYLQLFS